MPNDKLLDEEIITGYKFKKQYIDDNGTETYKRISFWSKASDIEFDDGENLEEKFRQLFLNLSTLKELTNTYDDQFEKIQSDINAVNSAINSTNTALENAIKGNGGDLSPFNPTTGWVVSGTTSYAGDDGNGQKAYYTVNASAMQLRTSANSSQVPMLAVGGTTFNYIPVKAGTYEITYDCSNSTYSGQTKYLGYSFAVPNSGNLSDDFKLERYITNGTKKFTINYPGYIFLCITGNICSGESSSIVIKNIVKK